MVATQVPKGFGLLLAAVGVPLILWDAAGTGQRIQAIDARSSTPDARLEACMTKTADIVSIPQMPESVCGCIVDKAEARGAYERYGSYDEAKLEPIIGECLRGG